MIHILIFVADGKIYLVILKGYVLKPEKYEEKQKEIKYNRNSLKFYIFLNFLDLILYNDNTRK